MLVLGVIALPFLSCEDDNADGNVPSEVRTAFAEKYPSAQNVKWSNKNGYSVVEFTENSTKSTAWFDTRGTWQMTETDIPFNALPEAVKNAFNNSEYGQSPWRLDDVDKLEREGFHPVYVIEVEASGDREMDLFYNGDGTLIKAVADNDDDDYEDHLPDVATDAIKAFIEENYPGARIVEIEREDNRTIEVDIIHANRSKEVVFDLNNNWLETSWEIKVSDLPQAVREIVNDPAYAGYHIDDADFVETPQGNYYLLELEKGNSEIKVKVDETGKVLN